MTATAASTVRDIVEADFRAAAVLHRYRIDFCSHGDRSLEEACRERGVDPAIVLEEITSTCAAPSAGGPRFAAWDAETLIAYIADNHHRYVRDAIPPLLDHTAAIAAAHGARHPELPRVAQLFASMAADLTTHLHKEEHILFPCIAALSAAVRRGLPVPPSPFGTVGNPIRVMEMEHQAVATALAEIRRLTGGYQPPADACATYRVCLQELEAFEADLHVHVQLENENLFPKALRLEAGV
jgi:regulator of cell morphogenesis and NO signaling